MGLGLQEFGFSLSTVFLLVLEFRELFGVEGERMPKPQTLMP